MIGTTYVYAIQINEGAEFVADIVGTLGGTSYPPPDRLAGALFDIGTYFYNK